MDSIPLASVLFIQKFITQTLSHVVTILYVIQPVLFWGTGSIETQGQLYRHRVQNQQEVVGPDITSLSVKLQHQWDTKHNAHSSVKASWMCDQHQDSHPHAWV